MLGKVNYGVLYIAIYLITSNFAYFAYASTEATLDTDVPINRDSSVIYPADVKGRI